MSSTNHNEYVYLIPCTGITSCIAVKTCKLLEGVYILQNQAMINDKSLYQPRSFHSAHTLISAHITVYVPLFYTCMHLLCSDKIAPSYMDKTHTHTRRHIHTRLHLSQVANKSINFCFSVGFLVIFMLLYSLGHSLFFVSWNNVIYLFSQSR